jgi:hypothetical protein
MPQDGTMQEGGSGRSGPLADPAWLAAGAAGLAAAVLALWAFRHFPLGPLALWLAPLPLFMAGIGFGAGAAVGAMGVAAVTIYAAGSTAGLWIVVIGMAAPVAILTVAAASRGGGLGLPLALLGILPALGITVAAFWLADSPGGLEGTLRQLARSGLQRFDLAGHAGLASEIARVKAAAIGFWLALAWAGNAWLAGQALSRLGVAPAPRWTAARLPLWYVALPVIAFVIWVAADDEADAVELSLMLVLLVPLVLHGLAVLHTRTRGRGQRPMILGAVYVALVILFLPASLAVAGYGAFDILSRPSRNHGGPGVPPPPRS